LSGTRDLGIHTSAFGQAVRQDVAGYSRLGLKMTDLENLVDLVRAVAKEVIGDLQTLPPEELTGIVQEVLVNSGKQLSLQDAPPQFGGQQADGNPIIFLVRHYHSRIEAGHFYQCDLDLLDKKLSTSLKNVFKSRRWQELVQDAAKKLPELGLPTKIRDRRIAWAQTLSHILPGRRNIRHERPADNARHVADETPQGVAW
jgi:hypothetical protein